MAYTVKQVAEMAGVTVRALHHYDRIGLLKPDDMTPASYRLYSAENLARLQQILFFRELGFSLREIREILDNPGFDRARALHAHRGLLLKRRERLDRLIRTVDATLASMEGGQPMDDRDLFDGFDPSQYEDEGRQRWGHTRAWAEAQERTRRYTREDWAAIQREGREIEEGLAALMDRDPADPEVQALVRRHHQRISERFYTCPAAMYRGLADMYVDDPRFAAHFDAVQPGLAGFLRDAIHVYCDRLEAQSVE